MLFSFSLAASSSSRGLDSAAIAMKGNSENKTKCRTAVQVLVAGVDRLIVWICSHDGLFWDLTVALECCA